MTGFTRLGVRYCNSSSNISRSSSFWSGRSWYHPSSALQKKLFYYQNWCLLFCVNHGLARHLLWLLDILDGRSDIERGLLLPQDAKLLDYFSTFHDVSRWTAGNSLVLFTYTYLLIERTDQTLLTRDMLALYHQYHRLATANHICIADHILWKVFNQRSKHRSIADMSHLIPMFKRWEPTAL